jgi:hypothetical protein
VDEYRDEERDGEWDCEGIGKKMGVETEAATGVGRETGTAPEMGKGKLRKKKEGKQCRGKEEKKKKQCVCMSINEERERESLRLCVREGLNVC